MVRFKRFDSKITSGLIPLTLFISNYVFPLAALYAIIKILQYFFVKNWDNVLLKAAKDGELNALHEAIKKNGDIEAKEKYTEITPLIIAAIHNQKAILSALISAGANVDARDAEGRVALMFAAKMGYIDIVQILLAKGSDANSRGYDGTTALILAARNGHTETLRIIIARGADIGWKDTNGQNALQVAINQHHRDGGRMQIIKILLAQGSRLESKNSTGWTALATAAFCGHVDVIMLLLKSGAEVDAKAEDGLTALIIAAQNGFDDAVNVLLDQGADSNLAMTNGTTALIAASTRGYPSIVTLLLKAGAGLNSTCDETTALMYAIIEGYKDVAFLLLDGGCDVDTVNKQGWSPLLLASEGGCYQILTRLIKIGANVNVMSKDAKWTPLMSACANGFDDIAEELIVNGADVNAQQAGGWTSMMIAVRAGQTSIVRLLIQHKAKVFNTNEEILPNASVADLKDIPDGAIPLIAAVLGGHTEIISILLKHGANPNAKTSRGQSALMIATSLGNKADINLLLKENASVPIFEDLGYTMFRMGWVQIRGILGAGGHSEGGRGSGGEGIREVKEMREVKKDEVIAAPTVINRKSLDKID